MLWWSLSRGLQQHTRHLATQSTSLASALDLISSQPSHYIIASLVGQRYLLAPRDLLTVPRLRDVGVGDTIALTDIHELGSREFTLQGETLADAGLTVFATVVEHTKGQMEHIFKKKRRKGYQRTIKHKQPYTRLRIGEFQFKEL